MINIEKMEKMIMTDRLVKIKIFKNIYQEKEHYFFINISHQFFFVTFAGLNRHTIEIENRE